LLIQEISSSSQTAGGNSEFEGSFGPDSGWLGREYDSSHLIEGPFSLPLNLAQQ
jgi:hypothetical protein